MAHTPGNWFVDRADDDYTVSSEHGQVICRALMADDFPCLDEGAEAHMNDEARANARLIAAAPQMLAELRAARKVIAALGADLASAAPDAINADVAADIRRIDAAIAAATGGE
jgi:hypothetical protein